MPGAKERLADKLRGTIRGEVVSDPGALRRYARDQSLYEVVPRVAALPEDREDVQRLIEFASREGIPLTPRGGGSGTAGAALGSGIVVALPRSEAWSGIGELTIEGGRAGIRVGAAVSHNALQQQLKGQGYFLPADVSSADISCIGGNIATKASGPHALRYGSIDRFVTSLEFVTAQGEVVNTADARTIPERFRTSIAELESRLAADAPARERLAARRLKTASGYNLFAFLDPLSPGRRLARLLCGSVGTLGLVTGATLQVELFEQDRAAVLLYFDDLTEAGRAVLALRDLDVSAIELISRETVQVLKEKTDVPAGLAVDAHLLLVELAGSGFQEGIRNIKTLLQTGGFRLARPPAVARNEAEIERLWALRKQILWLIRHPQPHLRALSVVNDVGVPPEKLASFVQGVQQVFADRKMIALIYGHAGNGNLHLRPLFDLTLPDLPGRIRELAEAVYELVLKHHGTVTAEHGMGPLRAPFLRREWGGPLYDYMREVKRIFDPDDLLNPGAMFNQRPITDNIRQDLLAGP
ncbi:MAG: FAD-binding oxidoreductase [Syntrophotaleaceae bacterium]